MKKLLLLPTAVFPWLVCAFLAAPLEQVPFLAEHLDAFVWALLGVFVLAVICNIVYMVLSKEAPAAQTIKDGLLLKACHIVPYVLIFIFGLLLAPLFFFTMPAIVLFVFLDLCFLWLGNMISIFALIKAIRGSGPKGLYAAALACQFFFCADIISLFVLYVIRRGARAVM